MAIGKKDRKTMLMMVEQLQHLGEVKGYQAFGSYQISINKTTVVKIVDGDIAIAAYDSFKAELIDKGWKPHRFIKNSPRGVPAEVITKFFVMPNRPDRSIAKLAEQALDR